MPLRDQNGGVESAALRVGPAQWTETELVAGISRREGAAWGELYRRHGRAVEQASWDVLRNAADASDVAVEVLEQLWERPDAFDPARGSLLGFLRTRSRRRSIDVMRAELRRRRREQVHDQANPRFVPSTEDRALSHLLASEMRELLLDLPASEREAIALAYFVGLPYASVALALEEAEGTVKSRIRRGIGRLRVVSASTVPATTPSGACSQGPARRADRVHGA